jgi:hypothetical protein
VGYEHAVLFWKHNIYFENHDNPLDFMQNILNKLVHLLYQRSSYTLEYIMVHKCLVFAQRQGDVMPW